VGPFDFAQGDKMGEWENGGIENREITNLTASEGPVSVWIVRGKWVRKIKRTLIFDF